jgi:WD40 repeat protein
MPNSNKGASFLVGIDIYDDAYLKNFRKSTSAKDVQAVKNVLRQEASQYWPPQEEFELVDRRITYNELKQKLTDFLSVQDYSDVLIYFSGHGYQYLDEDDDTQKGYLATSDSKLSSFINAEGNLTNQQNGLAFQKIATLISKATHLKSLVLLIDSCHSGHAVVADDMQAALSKLHLASLNKSSSDTFRYCIISSSLKSEKSWIQDGMGVFTTTLVEELGRRDAGPISAEQLSMKVKLNFQSHHQQTLKPTHAGYILLMDYSLDGIKKPTVEPIYADKEHTKLKNPYQGLNAFDLSSYEFFYGRETFVARIIEQFKATAFVPIIGASGGGKSSVVKAGLFPALINNGQWEMMEFKPGDDPLGSLKLNLEGLKSVATAVESQEALRSFIRKPTKDKFIKLLELIPKDKKFLLLIDQFEETFTLASQIEDLSEREEALQNQATFIDIITEVEEPLHVVMTMRADFLEPCLEFSALNNLIQDYALYLPPLRGQALRDAIQKPAERQGYEVEPSLVDRLEVAVANELGALPLLEFALTQLWELQQSGEDKHKCLTLAAYEALGNETMGETGSGLKGALNSHADAVFQFFDWEKEKSQPRNAETQNWIRRIFLQLIRPGEGTSDTRQRQSKGNLLNIAGQAKTHTAERNVLEKLILELVKARLLVTGEPEQKLSTDQLERLTLNERKQWAEENAVVDLAHEALIDGWKLFRHWRKEVENLLRLRANIEGQRKQWQKRGCHENDLMTRGLLAQIKQVSWEALLLYIRDDADVEFYVKSQTFINKQDAYEKHRNEKLQQALLESQLQLKASESDIKFTLGDKKAALEQIIQAIGENIEHLPDKILGPLRRILYKIIEFYPLNTLQGHRGVVSSVVISSDGQAIVSGSRDGTVRVWSLKEGKLLRTMKAHKRAVESVAISQDGQTIVSGSSDGTVRVWNTRGKLLRTLVGHQNAVESVAISPDGQTIVSGGYDQTVRVWDINSTVPLKTLEGHDAIVRSVAISPDGQTIVSSSEDRTMRVWSLEEGILFHIIKTDAIVRSVAISPDGQTIVSADYGGMVRVWSLEEGTPLRSFHDGQARSVAISPNGQTIVSSGYDSIVRVWSFEEGKLLRRLEGHDGEVQSVAISPDGQTIVSGGKDKTVQVWSLNSDHIGFLCGNGKYARSLTISPDSNSVVFGNTDGTIQVWSINGKLLNTLKAHKRAVESVAISQDGQTIVSGSSDGTVRVWNTRGKLLRTLVGHQNAVESVAISPDGQIIVSGGCDQTVRVWDINSTVPLKTFEGHDAIVRSVAISPDGQTIVSGGKDKMLRVWNLKEGKPVYALKGHDKEIRSVAISLDGQTIVSGGKDKTIRVWNIKGKLLRTLEGHQSAVESVAISPDGQTIVSGGEDGTVWVCSIDGKHLKMLNLHMSSVKTVAISSDGQTIISGSTDRTVRMWSISGRILQTFGGHGADVQSVIVSPDGQIIVSGSADKTVQVWSIDGTPLKTLVGHRAEVRSVAISSNGYIIVSGSADKTVRLWSIEGKLLRTFEEHEGTVQSVAISPDGQTIVSGGEDKTIRVWSLDGTLLKTLEGHRAQVCSVAISPDGQTIVSGGEDKTIRVWNLKEGKLLCTCEKHEGTVQSVAISPNGQTIVSGGEDKTIRVWSLDGTLLKTLEGHRAQVCSVAISPDGQTIVTSSFDNTVRMWSFDGTLLKIIEGHKSVVKSVVVTLTNQIIGSFNDARTVSVCEHTSWLACSQRGFSFLYSRLNQNKNVSLETNRAYLIDKGYKSAKKGKIKIAISQLVKAFLGNVEDSNIDDLKRRAEIMIAPILLKEAKRLAQIGLYEESKFRFEQANQLDPKLNIDPALEAGRPTKFILKMHGIVAALQDKISEAIFKFELVKQYGLDLELDPETEAKRIAAPVLVEQGKELANALSVEDAIAKFEQANLYNPTLELEPEIEAKRIAAPILFEEGKKMIKESHYQEALDAYQLALSYKADFEISPKDWNTLLWNGSLHAATQKKPKLVKDLLEASQKALESEPENHSYKDTLGVAKVIVGSKGRMDSAIKDFKFFIEKTNSAEHKEQRQRWIVALQEGQNPLTEDEIQTLFDQ